MNRVSRLLAGVAAGLLVVVLGGCSATVSTRITVTSQTSAAVTAEVVFTDEAAQALKTNQALRQQLLGVFSDRTGKSADYQSEDGKVIISTDLTYDQLKNSHDVLGLSGLTLKPQGELAALSVHLENPDRLRQAITQANASQPDAAALTETMLRSTTLTTQITFPGGVETSSLKSGSAQKSPKPQLDTSRNHKTISVNRTADDATDAQLEVSGRVRPVRWPWVVGVLLLAGVATGLVMRRRRSNV